MTAPDAQNAGYPPPPSHCPACGAELVLTRLQCPECGTEVAGTFASGRLIDLPEPHASLLELFLRVRGNVKDVERELGLSYPTVRARLEEAFAAARPKLTRGADEASAGPHAPSSAEHDAPARAAQRATVLASLERSEITAAEAATHLRALKTRTLQ